MNFLHYEFEGGPASEVEVTLDHPANVQLMDTANFSNYQRNQSFRYIGGHAKQSPIVLSPPAHGHWHVVIDLGGAAGSVRASVRVRQESAA